MCPTEQDLLEKAMIDMADQEGCCPIVATGGTGPVVRDVTPEVTVAACEKLLPGFGEQMRQVSLRYVPIAILSRQTAGIRGSTLICLENRSLFENVWRLFSPLSPIALTIINRPYLQTNQKEMKVFRPGQGKWKK